MERTGRSDAMSLLNRLIQISYCLFVFIASASSLSIRSEMNKNECHLCHLQKSLKYVPKKHSLERFHQDYSLNHGKTELSCNHCHDKNNHNYLKESASFKHPEAVCKRCHYPQFKEWTDNIHGKQEGGWKIKGEKWNCIKCHTPHSIAFKKMKASAPPKNGDAKKVIHK